MPRQSNHELKREDANTELTKLLLHGYGSLTIKVHDHRIAALDTTTRQLKRSAELSEGVANELG